MMAKLNPAEREAIAREYQPGVVSIGDLAKRYRVAPSSICRVLRKAKERGARESGSMANEWAVEYLDPRDLTPAPYNYRRHPESQTVALSESVAEHGWLAAPIVNRRTGMRILDGHARVELAKASEERLIPVRVVDVSERQEKRILASFDRVGELRERDDASLTALLQDLAGDGGLPAGWNEGDLAGLLAGLTPASGLLSGVDPDALPEAVETRCQAGELWQMGQHRLLCGDSTKREDVERLMGGKRAAVCLTDPPFNIGFQFEGEYAGQDSKTPAEYGDWLRSALTAVTGSMIRGAPIFVWQAMLNITHFHEWFAGYEWRLFAACKNFTRVYPCWLQYSWDPVVCWTHGEREERAPAGMRDYHIGVTSNTAATPDRILTGQHPCPRPLDTVVYLVECHSRPSEIVYDGFAGSGTTLVACEQTGRAARCMEIEPRYCDVILARWEQATGKAAERLESATPA